MYYLLDLSNIPSLAEDLYKDVKDFLENPEVFVRWVRTYTR